MKRNRALILGGAGFLGSHVAQTFIDAQWQVGVIDGLVPGTGGTPENLANCRGDLHSVVLKRIEETENLTEHILWANIIVDAIAFTGHLIGFQDPLMDTSCNLLSHLHLVQALRKSSGKRVIYLGSRGQYGAASGAHIIEETPCKPLDPQGINKLAAEHFLRIYGQANQYETVSLRLTNCFGPRQRINGERGLVGSFIHSVLQDKPIEIFGSPGRRKNVLYAEDVAKIVLQLASKEWKGFQIFNVGGEEVSLRELLEAILEAVGKGGFTVKPFPEEVKKIDVGEANFSDEKLNSFLGSRQRTPIREAIPLTVQYFKENRGKERP